MYGRRGPLLIALAIAVLSCQSQDTQVGCTPMLTCSLRPTQFVRPDAPDAGQAPCGGDTQRRCRASHVSAGGAHVCAIAQAGELFCWGDDREGQLGHGSVSDGGVLAVTGNGEPAGAGVDAGVTPVLEHIVDVAAGAVHTCAIGADHRTYCWGGNAEGAVDGVAEVEPVLLPREVQVTNATAISAGAAHSCALTVAGVVCWGSARFGQVGRRIAAVALEPDIVPGTEGAIEVAAGLHHSCARFADGHVSCWGELTDASSRAPRATAQAEVVAGLADATQITAGAGFSCAVRAGGRVSCWGGNDSGQLGDGTLRASATPVDVANLEPSLRVAAGGDELDGKWLGHACAVASTFFVHCWGRNTEGQLGMGTGPASGRPQVVLGQPGEEDDEPLLPDVAAVSLGHAFSCAIDHDGPVLCWGDNSFGQRGISRNQAAASFGRPVPVGIWQD